MNCLFSPSLQIEEIGLWGEWWKIKTKLKKKKTFCEIIVHTYTVNYSNAIFFVAKVLFAIQFYPFKFVELKYNC